MAVPRRGSFLSNPRNSGLRTSPRPCPAHPATPGSRTLCSARPRPASGCTAPTVGRPPRCSRLQRRENEPGGGGAARGHGGGGCDGGRPRHHVERPRPPSSGPGPRGACSSPLASRAQCVASWPEEEVVKEEEEEEEAPPSPCRAPSPLSALRSGPVWGSCRSPVSPRCATSLSRSPRRRSAR